MWVIFQAFVHFWLQITRLFVQKKARTADEEKAPGARRDLPMEMTFRSQYGEREADTLRRNFYRREMEMLQRGTYYGSLVYRDLHCATVVPPRHPKRAKQLRKHSAKYRLRQGEYVDNWDCELSKIYGNRSPQSLSPSPLLSGSSGPRAADQDTGEQIQRFPGRSPTFPCSPFLASTSGPQTLKQSPLLAQFTDLTQVIMMDFKPVRYSSNALSAVADTFWDAPVSMPAEPPHVFGYSYNRINEHDAFAASPSEEFTWSLPSLPTTDRTDTIYGIRDDGIVEVGGPRLTGI